ncbi:phage terminase large subunit [Bosea sp. RCC_152_1]|uniref:phage terminase large subunit n=1 Tax=Bosea sp. RCC_152_1 TaxID=3239228 RepID=UPI0035253433
MNEVPAELRVFKNFLFLVWQHLSLPNPTPIQYDLCDYLQNGPKRRIVEAFRGVGKSWITSAYVCWLLLLDPQHKILVVSASKERADAFSTFTLKLIREMPILAHLIPTNDQRESKIAFDVGPARAAHAPSVKSVGILGQLTGSRANTIVADDVEVPSNSATQAMRDKLSEVVKEFDALLSPGGQIVYLGTPQCEMSLYNALLDRGYSMRIWPALYPTEEQLGNYGDNLAPWIRKRLERGATPGTPTDVKRFSPEDLAERHLSYGKAGFSLQFMLDTRLSDQERYPLKLADLIVMACNPEMAPSKPVWGASAANVVNDVPNVGMVGDSFHGPAMLSEEWTEYTGSVMTIDPSGRGTDETTYAVVKHLHGFLYLLACGGFKDGYSDETMEGLADIAERHKVNHILIEPNFGDGMFLKLFQPVCARKHRCMIEDAPHASGMKEKRIIDTLEPVMMRHKLIVDTKVIKADYDSTLVYPTDKQNIYRLFYQMSRITAERGSLAKDDRLDVLAMAVAYWTESMARDEQKATQALIEKRKDEELRKFMDSFRRQSGYRGGQQGRWVRV